MSRRDHRWEGKFGAQFAARAHGVPHTAVRYFLGAPPQRQVPKRHRAKAGELTTMMPRRWGASIDRSPAGPRSDERNETVRWIDFGSISRTLA